MWLLNNLTPFSAERTWVRDENGAEVWIVAVKGTFLISEKGAVARDPEQPPVSRIPVFAGPPATSPLIHESDLVHRKLSTDVVLHGTAFAPGGRPATQVDARLRLANIDKTIRVFGDREIRRALVGIELSNAKPFLRMPLSYSKAFGGTDQVDSNPALHGWEPRNPIGVGYARDKERVIGQPAPNLEYPDSPYRHWRRGRPAGFGPIPRHWMPRVQRAGTYDKRWEEMRKPLLPSDFSDEFYQCSPDDQQVAGFLKGGELVQLDNLTPEGTLRFHLPKIVVGLSTRFYDGTSIQHRATLHTVLLYTDQRKIQLVWHSLLNCHHKVQKLRETTVLVKHHLSSSIREWQGAAVGVAE